MDTRIKEAVQLLRENGYIVKKITSGMQKDSDECEKMGCEKECLGCACNLCIMQ